VYIKSLRNQTDQFTWRHFTTVVYSQKPLSLDEGMCQEHKCNSWNQRAATEEYFQRLRISLWNMRRKWWRLCRLYRRLTVWFYCL